MKTPTTLRAFRSIAIFLMIAGLISLLGLGLHWAAARGPVAQKVRGAAPGREAQGFAKSGFAAPSSAMQACSLNCTATVPATGQAGATIGFAATATPTGCGSAPSFEWSFGDNTPVSSLQNPSHVYAAPGTYNWSLTTRTTGGGAALIETVAGGLGEGNPAAQVSFATLVAVARDSQGRGVYLAEDTSAGSLIRFLNLTSAPVTIAGVAIAPGTVRLLAGGGFDVGENVRGVDADLGSVSGLAVSPNGQLLYFVDAVGRLIRALNTTNGNVTVGGASIGSGRVGSLTDSTSGFGSNLNGLSVNPTTGDLYVVDATNGINKVYRVTPAGAITAIAGNGAATSADAPLPSPPLSATSAPLLLPRAVRADGSGNVFIADTGHGRVVKVDSAGNMTLVVQFQTGPIPPNPYPSGLALLGNNLYVANGNALTIMRVTGGTATVAGSASTVCDYSTSNCGDGGPGVQASFNLLNSINAQPLAGIDSDGNGLFILDQGAVQRSRVRYLNLGASSTTIAGVIIGPNQINTIAGAGLRAPYDRGLATGASLNTPVGVAATAQGDLFIADTVSNRLRFVNRGANLLTLFPGTMSEQTVGPGQIVTVNNGPGGGPDDAAPVSGTVFDAPQGMTTTAQGLFITDSRRGPNVPSTLQGKRTGLIRFVNTTGANVTFYSSSGFPIVVPPGFITTIAGGGTNSGTIGDNGFATSARFVGPSDVAVSPTSGDIYVADVGNKAVRKINRNSGIVTSLSLPVAQYTGLGFDAGGRLYIVNNDANTLLREIDPGSGTFNTLATGLNRPRDVAIDATGVAYVTNSGNHRIVQVTSAGVVTTLAGTSLGFGGDGGPAASASLNLTTPLLTLNSSTTAPETVGITTGPSGDLFFTDSANHRIRRVSLGGGAITCVRAGTITIGAAQNPTPTITSLNPTMATAGGAAFTLTVNGTNFIAGSVVRWNGSDRTTSFGSGTLLTAQIPASDLTTAGTASVTVFNPAPGGGLSNVASFTVNNPTPQLSGMNPNPVNAGGPAFTLTISGTNFVSSSVAQINGSSRPTTVLSNTQLTTVIQAADIAVAGSANISVITPGPGGGASNTLTLAINNQAPLITDLSPAAATAGAAAFTLTINGSNFVNGAVAQWNGADRATTFVSATKVTAAILGSDIATAGVANVTVSNPAPGGGLSNALPVTINPGQPPARIVRVVNTNGAPGSPVSVSIELVSQGDENGISFSLSYPTATLGNPQVALGADAAGGLFNVNTSQTAQGNLGISLALPAGQKFAAGVRQILVVTFTIALTASGGPVEIKFTDRPILREIADVNATTLPAGYTSGVITVTPGFEGDVAPRPNGNGSLTISDWVLLGRFATGLETAESGSEFQRIDCAPRSALGDGKITLSDWVQGGRYSAGLDPLTPAGGPSAPVTQETVSGARSQMNDARSARAVRAVAASGVPNTMTIYIDARGDENAIGFSLQFDPTRVRFAGAELDRELGPDAGNATLLINLQKASSGRVGMTLALPAGRSLRAGVVGLMTVHFTLARGAAPSVARVGFGDEPVARETVDVDAQPIAANWPSDQPSNQNDVDLLVNARGIVSVSAASYTSDALAPEMIVAAFGDRLSTTTQTALALPLPFELAGTRVTTRDSAGVERPAAIFFVSPDQVNYLMPADLAAGPATVTITSGDGTVFREVIQIAPAALGLFTANADGVGVAAALALRATPDGSTRYEPVAQFDGAQGRFVPAPVAIPTGPEDEGDQVYLLLFGTGLKSAGPAAAVKATIGGVEAEVTYAGPQGDYKGLDQINLRLPRSLAGRGEVEVKLTVDGRAANPVRVRIQ